MRGRGDRGFTLIELGVTVALVIFMVASLAAVCAGIGHRSKLESTRSLLRALDAGCEAYRSRLGSYPGFPSASADTTVLYLALCVPVAVPSSSTQHLESPFVVLPSSHLACAPQIHDEWGWPVRYSLPGRHQGAGEAGPAFDIDASSSEGGVIGNWPAAR